MNLKRVRKLNSINYREGSVVYWISRDQRVVDNWAFIRAAEIAKEHDASLSVIFCLRKDFRSATERLVDFMLTGLEEVEADLKKICIQFYFLIGDPEIEIPKFIELNKIGYLITDFNPLKWKQDWNKKISLEINIPFEEVDAHNIVPVWEASTKQEFGAYTLRPKIRKLLHEFLEEFPENGVLKQKSQIKEVSVDWNKIRTQIKFDKSVKKVDWINPGEKEATKALRSFIEHGLAKYNQFRNDPTYDAQSNLSPYIHFGQISSQRIALDLGKIQGHTASKEAFLEELIIRKELSDNFCFYNPNYNSPEGFPNWAKKSLSEHHKDPRDYIYSLKELEEAKTHDELWNAAQIEMIKRGKMHGYLRMYWAKKILEWTKNPREAQKIAIYLNDKYFLDGRDPNGYTGIAWSIGGVHDRAWFDRPIFGKIRFMSYNGAKSKFNIKDYIEKVKIY